MRPAFTTVACPEWTLDAVARAAERWGYLGVELRTFGDDTSMLACDPALTAPAKVRQMFHRAGVEVMCLGTSLSFDSKPTLFHRIIGDADRSVELAKTTIDLAVKLECPFVRVFGFRIHEHDSRIDAMQRIADRLGLVAAYARHSGVRVLVENGGTFLTASDLAEVLDRVNHPLLGASYNASVAQAAGEAPGDGINVLADRVPVVKVKDFKDGVPCALGAGGMNCQGKVASLSAAGFDGWLVFEYPRLWFKDLPDPSPVLESSAKAMYSWIRRQPHPASLHV
jgi:sugar phosphate isomerase/epimerase